MKKLSFASLACLLVASACIVNPEDDDDNATSSTPTTNPTTDPTGVGTETGDAESSSGTPDESSGGASSGSGSSGDAFNCGWGELAEEDDFDFGYKCDGEGSDPDGAVALECPADLTEGGDCDAMGITGQGCCDADGNAWFCQDMDGDAGPMEPMVVQDVCD